MSSDDQDKTVFHQPSADQTIIRPTPGGRRGGGGAAPTPPPAGMPPQQSYQPQYQQPQYQQPQYQQPPPAAVDPQAAFVRATQGLNPLVNAAASLINVFEKTRNSVSHPNVDGLHQRLVNEIRTFDMHVRQQGLKQETASACSYVMCVALDEAVLNTPWGAESSWPQKTLLTTFHGETSGGERFFQILDNMRASPMENLYVIELMYIFLSLGFEGKYRFMERGRDALEGIRDELFAIIRSYRGEYERTLSPRWQGLGNVRKSLAGYIPTWVLAAFVGVVLVFTYSGFRYYLHEASLPVVNELAEVAGKEPAALQAPDTKSDNNQNKDGKEKADLGSIFQSGE